MNESKEYLVGDPDVAGKGRELRLAPQELCCPRGTAVTELARGSVAGVFVPGSIQHATWSGEHDSWEDWANFLEMGVQFHYVKMYPVILSFTRGSWISWQLSPLGLFFFFLLPQRIVSSVLAA